MNILQQIPRYRLVSADALAGKIQPPPGGLNIIGGVVELDGVRWLLKFVGEAEARAQAQADAIKPLFAGADDEPCVSRQIGVNIRQLSDTFSDRLVVARSGGPRDDKGRAVKDVRYKAGQTVLLLRFIDGLQAMRAAAVPAALRRRWIPVLALRLLVMGARDPWSNIQWLPAEARFVSFDEGTAFGDEMAPSSAARATYIGKAPKVTAAFRAELLAATPLVAELQARWLAAVTTEALLAVLGNTPDGQRIATTVRANLATLAADWTTLFMTAVPPPVAPTADNPDAFVDPPRADRAYNQRQFMGGLTVSAERSRLQKAARRGLADETRYAAAVMLGSQNITNLLHRLITMAVEDVCSPAVVIRVDQCMMAILDRKNMFIMPNKDGWRDLRNDAITRHKIAELTDFLAAAPASRMHDHIAGALFKEDHPFCATDGESTVPVMSTATAAEAPARIIQLLDLLLERWTLGDEQELLYLLGGMWGVLGGAPHLRLDKEKLPPGHALWLFHTMLRRTPDYSALSLMVDSLQSMFTEINATNAQKGKLFVIAAAVFWARSSNTVPPEHALVWTRHSITVPATTTADVDAEYQRLIAGTWRIPVHPWVFDLHAGNRRDCKVAFYNREQDALVNRVPAADPWFDQCVILATERHVRTGDRRGKRVRAAAAADG